MNTFCNLDTCLSEINKNLKTLDSIISNNPTHISCFSQNERNKIKWKLEEITNKIYSPYTSVQKEDDDECASKSSEE